MIVQSINRDKKEISEKNVAESKPGWKNYGSNSWICLYSSQHGAVSD